MFSYNKFLQYPVKICKPNPRLANVVVTQYGGPNGELGASLRYLSQRYTMPDEVTKGLLTDIGDSVNDWNPNHYFSKIHSKASIFSSQYSISEE